jgi:hypothetical protein
MFSCRTIVGIEIFLVTVTDPGRGLIMALIGDIFFALFAVVGTCGLLNLKSRCFGIILRARKNVMRLLCL